MRPAKRYVITIYYDDIHITNISVGKSQLEPVLKSLPYRQISNITITEIKELKKDGGENE